MQATAQRFRIGLRKSRVVKGVWRKRLARFAVISIALFYVIGFIGFLDSLGLSILPHDPLTTDVSMRYMSPSLAHPFGTDSLGRDVMTRVIYAMSTSAIISFLVILAGGVFINIGLSLIAGYYGGWRDSVIVKAGETLSGIPPLILLIVIIASVATSYREVVAEIADFLRWEWLSQSGIAEIFLLFAVMSVIGWVGSVFALRARIAVERERGYVESARALGASDFRIMVWHILPNLMGLIVLSLSALLIIAIGSEIGLSYLGLGVKSPNPSFGIMLFSLSVADLQNHLYLFIPPALIVTFVLFISWMLGDALVSIVESREMPQE